MIYSTLTEANDALESMPRKLADKCSIRECPAPNLAGHETFSALCPQCARLATVDAEEQRELKRFSSLLEIETRYRRILEADIIKKIDQQTEVIGKLTEEIADLKRDRETLTAALRQNSADADHGRCA